MDVIYTYPFFYFREAFVIVTSSTAAGRGHSFRQKRNGKSREGIRAFLLPRFLSLRGTQKMFFLVVVLTQEEGGAERGQGQGHPVRERARGRGQSLRPSDGNDLAANMFPSVASSSVVRRGKLFFCPSRDWRMESVMRLRSNMRDDLEMTLAGAKFFVLCSASMHENLKKTVKAIILQMEIVIQRAEHGLESSVAFIEYHAKLRAKLRYG